MAEDRLSSPSIHGSRIGDLPALELEYHYPFVDASGMSESLFRARERIDSEEINIPSFKPKRKNSEAANWEVFRMNQNRIPDHQTPNQRVDNFESLLSDFAVSLPGLYLTATSRNITNTYTNCSQTDHKKNRLFDSPPRHSRQPRCFGHSRDP